MHAAVDVAEGLLRLGISASAQSQNEENNQPFAHVNYLLAE
jgi:hypothetical protein